jgi:putative transposase
LASKKVRAVAVGERREWIDAGHWKLTVTQQCQLTGLSRSGLYYEPRSESALNLKLMRLLDERYTRTPFFGVLKMTDALKKEGYAVNPKRVRRLLRQMGLEAIYPKPRLSAPAPGHRIYPYRLRHVVITRPNQVWSSDITYIRLRAGFIYLVAVMDWFSRYVLSWEISTSLDVGFCCSALDRALQQGRPEIFNTDQGAQFTSESFTGRLEAQNILISMDGRGRALDNVFVERLWRTVKYEDVYLKDYSDPPDAVRNLGLYFRFYNVARAHQALGYQTPESVYFSVPGKTRKPLRGDIL